MSTIRVAWGSATGPTRLASYDAALAAANCHDYNLARLSSVIPTDTPVETVGTAPDLGSPGDRLSVVEARATVAQGTAVAGIGWAVSETEHGIFYEESGDSEAAVRDDLETGLRTGCDLREWSVIEPEIVTETATVDAEPTDVAPMADGGPERGNSRRVENGNATRDGRKTDERHSDDRSGDDHAADGRRSSTYASAVVIAAYGRSEPIV